MLKINPATDPNVNALLLYQYIYMSVITLRIKIVTYSPLPSDLVLWISSAHTHSGSLPWSSNHPSPWPETS